MSKVYERLIIAVGTLFMAAMFICVYLMINLVWFAATTPGDNPDQAGGAVAMLFAAIFCGLAGMGAVAIAQQIENERLKKETRP